MADDLDAPIWGAVAIAAAAGLTKTQAYYKLDRELLPATKVGGTFVTTKRRLRALWKGENREGMPPATQRCCTAKERK